MPQKTEYNYFFLNNFQVCDYQNKSKLLSRENDDLRSSLGAYAETQDELTAELADLKDKYR